MNTPNPEATTITARQHNTNDGSDFWIELEGKYVYIHHTLGDTHLTRRIPNWKFNEDMHRLYFAEYVNHLHHQHNLPPFEDPNQLPL